jgi:hypothetical protein
LRNGERKPVVTIPLVIRPIIERAQPVAIIIAIRVEQFRIAIRIAQNIIKTTVLGILQGTVSHSALKCPNILHQVSIFFKYFCSTLPQALTKNILKTKILAQGSNQP